MNRRETTTGRIRGTTPELDLAARELRRIARATRAERTLWQALRGRRLGGFKFRRQHPIGPFVLDFYCPVHNLAVELDGEIHGGQTEQDAARTEILSAYGCRVLRFRNEEVLSDPRAVLDRIGEAIASGGSALTPGPSPNVGRGENRSLRRRSPAQQGD